jgi:hypothetical protein
MKRSTSPFSRQRIGKHIPSKVAQHTTRKNTTNSNTRAYRGGLYINNISNEIEDSSFLAQ